MVLKNLCVLVLWTKVASAFEGLMAITIVEPGSCFYDIAAILQWLCLPLSYDFALSCWSHRRRGGYAA